mgnify:CR=1 FL=1
MPVEDGTDVGFVQMLSVQLVGFVITVHSFDVHLHVRHCIVQHICGARVKLDGAHQLQHQHQHQLAVAVLGSSIAPRFVESFCCLCSRQVAPLAPSSVARVALRCRSALEASLNCEHTGHAVRNK